MAPVGLAILGSGNTVSWKKWQIALAIGTPIVIGFGCWYYYTTRKRRNEETAERLKTTLLRRKNSEPTTERPSLPDPYGGVPAETSNGSLEDKADTAKITGNRLFKEGKYEEAVKSYSEAIALCPSNRKDSLATFYQNRAASFEKLKRYDEVVEDCSKALEFNAVYIKALNRRAKAYEHLKQFENALEDATAICVLEEFQNHSSLILADRILKSLGQQRAKDAMKSCTPRMPSNHFIKTYFSSFAEDPLLNFSSDFESSDPSSRVGFLKAYDDFSNERYDNIVQDCSADAEDSSKPWQNLAIILRATFYILRGQPEQASTEFNRLLQIENLDLKIQSNALIKLASLEVQHERLDKVFAYFKTAEDTDPDNTDIYHHRGQVNLLLDKVEEACQDFKKAITLNPDFAIAVVQKCYADYRYAHSKNNSAQLDTSMKEFKQAVLRFPNSAEGYALYAQALVDQQNFEKADKYYDKALQLEPYNANIYVHKGLLQLNWKQNFVEAVKLIEKAIETDDRCEFAYETLGALEVQKGNLDRALELFDKALESARTEPELAHLYSLRDAAAAQKRVASRLGILLPKFE